MAFQPQQESGLFQLFESLGNNCEFGIVQRRAGYDPPGLFRNVGFLSVEQIIFAISSDFASMFDDGTYSYDIRPGWPDYTLTCHRFGFTFHSGLPVSIIKGTPEWDREAGKNLAAFRFLKRKLREDFTTGEKIFVYRSKQAVPLDRVRELHSAIRSHGFGWLLYVHESTEKPSGWVSLIDDRLLIGTMARVSNENPPQIDFAAWDAIARKALRVRYGAGGLPPDWRSPGADTAETLAVPPPVPGLVVLSHRLTIDASSGNPVFHYVIKGVKPDMTHLAVVWVYLGNDFRGSDVGLAIWGRASLRFAKANLAERGWQQMWVIARSATDDPLLIPSLVVEAEAGSVLYTAGWDFGRYESIAEAVL